jgi:hypothetical protein
LRRRIARGRSLEDALLAGRHPTRRELATWQMSDVATQLAFPELVADLAVPSTRSRFIEVVRAHVGAIAALRALISSRPSRDLERARLLSEVRHRHAESRIVAFSQFADTVHGLFRLLRAAGGVAALTARGARLAVGSCSRAEALARFAPSASGADSPAPTQDIRLLLTTDLLSEGVNLQDAQVVVHLDLPWTAARLEQRLGRLARIGSRHSDVFVYVMASPARAEALLRVEERVRAKARLARRRMGASPFALFSRHHARARQSPSGNGHDTQSHTARNPPDASDAQLHSRPRATVARSSASELTEALRRELRGWSGGSDAQTDQQIVGAVQAPFDGFLALVQSFGHEHLLCSLHGRVVSERLDHLLRCARAAGGPSGLAHEQRCRAALAAIDAWFDARRAARLVDAGAIAAARTRVLRRIARIGGKASPQARATLCAACAVARRSVNSLRGAGAELALDALAGDERPDAQWLSAVAALSAAPVPDEPPDGSRCLALLLLQRRTTREA